MNAVAIDRALRRWAAAGVRLAARGWCCMVLILVALGSGGSYAAEDFLPPEQAFKVTARMADAGHAEIRLRIAQGYYLYREPFRFSAKDAVLGDAQIPAGKVKFDETFQKNVETYRDELKIILPISGVGAAARLLVVSQGCADAGLCYPPMTSELALNLPAGSSPEVSTAAVTSLSGAATASDPTESPSLGGLLREGRLWQTVAAFFGLGLLLSFTPCVLPMLPILSSLIVGVDQHPTRRRGLLLAACYSLGMATVYTALGVAAGLAGEGLAASLQTPWALGGFALLLALFALSMFDVYQLRMPERFTGSVTSQCNRLPPGRVLGVFLMGGMSALIVSPCVTAPLAATLLFIGQSGDVTLGGAALFAMALGMSVPLMVLGASAGRWLPRAGGWMHGVKRSFGFLMLGMAIWVAQPVLPASVALALWGLLLLVFGFTLEPFSKDPHHRHVLRHALQRAAGLASLVLGAAQLLGAASGGFDPLKPLGHLQSRAGRESAPTLQFASVDSSSALDAALAAAVTAGQPVVLDFYADWCVSCKEMDRFTFQDAKVAARLQKAVLLKADVTANAEAHRGLLKRFGLFGPPGTIFFDRSGKELAGARVIGFQSPTRFGQTLDLVGL